MTFPTLGLIDDFNRANTGPPPGPNWTTISWADGGLRVLSNQCEPQAGVVLDNFYGAYWNAGTLGPNCEIYVTVSTVCTGDNVDVVDLFFRLDDPDNFTNFYELRYDNQGGASYALRLYRTKAGISTQLQYSIFVLLDGDKVGMSIVGDTLEVYRYTSGAWNLLFTVVDPDPLASTPGYFGLAMKGGIGGTFSVLDDFGGGALPNGFTGSFDQALDALTLEASGYLERLGDFDQALDALTVSATGEALSYHDPTLINVRDITASGAGAIGVKVVNHAISQNVRANSLQVENGGVLEAHSVYYDSITTIGTGEVVPLKSDRAVWDVENYSQRHASDIDGSTWVYHRNPALGGSYTVIDPSVLRILDVASVSLNEVAAVLGTLLSDLGLA